MMYSATARALRPGQMKTGMPRSLRLARLRLVGPPRAQPTARSRPAAAIAARESGARWTTRASTSGQVGREEIDRAGVLPDRGIGGGVGGGAGRRPSPGLPRAVAKGCRRRDCRQRQVVDGGIGRAAAARSPAASPRSSAAAASASANRSAPMNRSPTTSARSGAEQSCCRLEVRAEPRPGRERPCRVTRLTSHA